jgi:galactokinase
MMGGGFGGCTFNLIKSNEIPDVVSKIKERYKSNFGINLKATIAKPGSGIKVFRN